MRSVFISHASQNKELAEMIADILKDTQIKVLLDAHEVKLGTDFIQFMEEALTVSNFCLLLWSEAASKSEWVTLEWESALHKTIQELPGFLIIGRADDFPLPFLLRPRLFVDLFPTIQPNIREVLKIIEGDEQACESIKKIVVKPKCEQEYREGSNIYITSKLFKKTFPIRVPLQLPAIAVVEIVITELGLPRVTGSENPVSIRYEYNLANEHGSLSDTRTLEDQQVRENDVLWLETDVQPFAGLEPVSGRMGSAKYRSSTEMKDKMLQKSQFLVAREVLQNRVENLGLN